MHLARFRQYSTFAIHSNDNDLWKTSLLQFVTSFSRLPSLPQAMSPRVDQRVGCSCISSVVPRRWNHSRMRLVPRSSRISSKASDGTGSGHRSRTRTTSAAPAATAMSSGSSLPMKSRPRRHQLSRAFLRFGQRAPRALASQSSSRSHRADDVCSSAAPGGPRRDDTRPRRAGVSDSLRGAARAAPFVARRRDARPRTASRSSHRDADLRQPRHARG